MTQVAQPSLEQWVGSLWSEVIGTAHPRPSDSFTALGGHSLHAVRVVFLLRQRLGIPVPLAVIFDTTDLAELCQWLRSELDRSGATPTFQASRSLPGDH